MKLFLSLLAVLLFTTPAPASERHQELGAFGPPVMGVVAAGAWNFGVRSVLLFRYQIGAAYMRAELYGIGADQVPTRLDEIKGLLIELLDINGVDGLRVFDTADMRDPPVCLRWDAPVHRLVPQSCNSVGAGKTP